MAGHFGYDGENMNFVNKVEVAMAASSIQPKHSLQDATIKSTYIRYDKRIYSLCLRLLADMYEAETATVEAFVQFGRALVGQWDESRTELCLREMAVNAALSRLHQRTRVEQPVASTGMPSNGSGSKSHGRLEPAVLDGLIARLPEIDRVVYVLHDVEGVNDGAIAVQLQITELAMRQHLSKARLELRRLWRSN